MFKKQHERGTGERGQVLVLVLVALALGAWVIGPSLNYVNTGLNAARISREHLLKHYATDGAVEYSLWQLAYNVGGIIDSLDLTNPSTSTLVTLNGMEVPTTIELSLFQGEGSGEGSELPPMPPTEPGPHVEALLNVTPKWVPCGQENDLLYDLYIRNYGTASVGLHELHQILPPGFNYVEGSYVGPTSVFTKEWVTDHWELHWDFTPPRPRIRSGESLLVSFTVSIYVTSGSQDEFGSGWVYYQAGGEEEIQLNYGGTQDPVAIGLYDVTATAGNSKVLANSSVCDGVVKVNSYQIE